jgi:hypothetical protein
MVLSEGKMFWELFTMTFLWPRVVYYSRRVREVASLVFVVLQRTGLQRRYSLVVQVEGDQELGGIRNTHM